MKIIGLTGGIGSGKSTVSSYLADAGIPIVDADRIAHEITEPGQPALRELADAFGMEILGEDGTLDRKKLAQLAFSSEEQKKILERITHRAIRQEIDRQIAEAKARRERRVVLDAPLLIESGLDQICDCVWVVIADERVRRSRIAARDGLSDAQITARIKSQLSDEIRRRYADETIENSGEREALYRQVKQLLAKYE